MDNQPTPPANPDIPTPDVSLSSIPSPLDQPGSSPAAPPVNVRTIDAKEAVEREVQAGSLAPINSRIIAALIDSLVVVGLNMAVHLLLPHFLARILWLVGPAYMVCRDSLSFLGGQSVGKKAMKIKTVTVDGKSLVNNWEPALIRNAILAIPVFPLIELFVLLTREGKPEQGRRLGDEWAKTKVVIAPDASTAG